jgi:hypothetical protein
MIGANPSHSRCVENLVIGSVSLICRRLCCSFVRLLVLPKLAINSLLWAGLLVALIIAGCGPASINPGTETQPVSTGRPTAIVVYDFAVSSAEVTQNQAIFQRALRAVTMNSDEQQASELQTGHETAKDLSDTLVKQLTDLGFNAQVAQRGTPAPNGALLIDGQFVNIDEGNRLRRLVIGFGAGASKLDTQVKVYQVAGGTTAQLLDFTTHAESGKMPGAAFTMGAGAAAQGGVTAATGAATMGLAGAKTYRSATGYLAGSTAKQIVAYFSQYAANQGWISADQVQKVKYDQSAQ